MNKEYASTCTEYPEVSDYIEIRERLDVATSEYFKEFGEYCDNGKEYADSIEPEMMVGNPKKTKEKEQKKKKQHRKTLQSMAYTVASVATVAVLMQATEPVAAKESIAGATIVFEGSGELTQEDVLAKLENYEMDGDFKVVIEEGITGIEESAFANYDNLVSVEISDSVNMIGHSAFNECNNLKIEKLTTNGRMIQHFAFGGVTIEELEVSESLIADGNSSFSGVKINYVSFEEGISVIPAKVFSNCDSIEEIRIPDSVTEIRDSSFVRCNNLKIVEIPDSVENIGQGAFSSCKNLILSVAAGSYAEAYAIEEGLPYQSN